MCLRKKGFPLQNIRALLHREDGQISWGVGMFLVLFLALYLYAALQMERFRAASLYLEDALTASNLASVVVDIEEYGISHRILIPDCRAAYDRYQVAVCGNLNLNHGWRTPDGGVIEGEVRVLNYTVYNVDGDVVRISSFDESGQLRESVGLLGEVYSPHGVGIESTSVYSEITFPVECFPGVYVEAWKGKLVDVVK